MRNIRDTYGHEYIFLIRKQKLNDLANVRPKLSSFEANRANIAEVRAEWNFCRSYIIRYEVIVFISS